LSRWSSGITVVTCRRPEGVHGMTASSFTSLSLDPPLILVCVAKHAGTHGMIAEEGALGVHILGEGMEVLSDRCAGFHGIEGHWLNDVPSHAEHTGAPILDHSLAWLDCTVWNAYDGGDHTIYIGEIQAAGVQDGAPLLWFQRGYHLLAKSHLRPQRVPPHDRED
jgi:flavin reductase (DIM6/NTAB) family NADH-FMN oxidoreductase RutF